MAYPNNQLVTRLVMLYALARAWVATILEYASLEKRPAAARARHRRMVVEAARCLVAPMRSGTARGCE